MNAMQSIIITAFVSCLLLHITAAKSDFELQFENFSCSSNPQQMKRVICSLNKNPKRRNLNMEFALLATLNDFDFLITIVIPRRSTDFVLLNLTINGCHFLANKRQVPLMHVARQILDHYSNLPQQCPFERDKSYYLRSFRLDLSLVPAAAVETPFHIHFAYRRRQVLMLEGHIFGQLQRTVVAKKREFLNEFLLNP